MWFTVTAATYTLSMEGACPPSNSSCRNVKTDTISQLAGSRFRAEHQLETISCKLLPLPERGGPSSAVWAMEALTAVASILGTKAGFACGATRAECFFPDLSEELREQAYRG